ncbi:MmgE/PrpD family protein [Desulfobacula sp.]|uniref:MmgE/PrpD family protein n=1 Tax=Desulfobacula sp. TaxID=2593537 RepID=UPI002615DCFB|nr:MmgE/PrpD family protein [Desulfobacula sp.]
MKQEQMDFSRRIIRFITETNTKDIPPEIYEHAKIAFLDWLGVTLAGKDDPLVEKLIRYADLMGGNKHGTLIGRRIKKSLSQAALINGAASHALDYDDTLMTYVGHPTVTMIPSLLALSEWKEKSGIDFLTAYIIGMEAASVIGTCAGMDHYMHGWHATSTIGHFASAAVCSRLLGLTGDQTFYAFGIAGTQACGLKISFGTMCKPFHAGRASQAGLMAALLAADGFTSAHNILEGPKGFFHVLNGEVKEDIVKNLGETWNIKNLAQKYHASCHATHSAIEAARSLVRRERISIDKIKSIRIHTSELSLGIVGNAEPKTGLEGKFSVIYCVANALLKENTGMQAFTDEVVMDPAVRTFMEKISIKLDKDMAALGARVEIETDLGEIYSMITDIIKDIPDLGVKRSKIKDKFIDLSKPVLGDKKTEEILEKVFTLEKIDNLKPFIEDL